MDIVELRQVIKDNCYGKTGKVNPFLSRASWWETKNLIDIKETILKLTYYLDDNVPWRIRIKCAVANINSIPICASELCNYPVIITLSGITKYCSKKCGNRSKHNVAKKTCLRKYGVEHHSALDSIKEKTKITNIKRYGCEYSSSNNEVKEKRKKTWKKIIDNRDLCDKINKKKKETTRARYGVDHISKLASTKKKTKDTNIKRYGVDHPMKSVEIKNRLFRSNLEKYGVIVANGNMLNEETNSKLDDRIWLERQHAIYSPSQIAGNLSVSVSLVYKRLAKHGIVNVNDGSCFELEIKEVLRDVLDKNTEMSLNNRKIINPYEIDIYLPEQNIAIECNGSYWHSENQGRGKDYHLMKTNMCENQGIRLIHIWEHEWRDKRDIIVSRLQSVLNVNKRVYARKTNITNVCTSEIKSFLNKNHIQGWCPSSVKLGLEYNDEIVAIMTFGKSRFNKSVEWELLRYCSKRGMNITGGAGKLLKYFIRTYEPKSIISYSDKMWNTGDLYKQLGFDYLHSSSPAYYYTDDYISFKNRIVYQKHKLKNKLKTFDPCLTEWENMQDNGFDRIWDCGNDVWLWNVSYFLP